MENTSVFKVGNRYFARDVLSKDRDINIYTVTGINEDRTVLTVELNGKSLDLKLEQRSSKLEQQEGSCRDIERAAVAQFHGATTYIYSDVSLYTEE